MVVTICYLFRNQKTYLSHDERLSLREKPFLQLFALFLLDVAYSTSSVADSHIVMICDLPGNYTPVVSLLPTGGITDPNWGFGWSRDFPHFPAH